MRHVKLIPPFPAKRRNRLLLVCALATLCLSQAALAQSGRRQNRNPSAATPPPVTSEPAVDTSTAKAPIPIASVIVAGDLVQSGSSFSNHVDAAVDACVKELKQRQAIEPKGSGSLKRAAAIERAKKETDAYLLWLEIKLVDRVINDSRGIRVEEYISCVNYYVFKPQTAEILTEGIVYPGKQEVRSGGAVLRLPTSSRRLPMTHELEQIGRQVANRVRDKLR